MVAPHETLANRGLPGPGLYEVRTQGRLASLNPFDEFKELTQPNETKQFVMLFLTANSRITGIEHQPVYAKPSSPIKTNPCAPAEARATNTDYSPQLGQRRGGRNHGTSWYFAVTLMKCDGAGEHTLRTSFAINLIWGLPYYQHNLAPFVAEPFHFSLKSTMQSGLPEETAQQDHGTARHPIWRVFDWQRRLDEEKALTKVQIGEQEGYPLWTLLRMRATAGIPH